MPHASIATPSAPQPLPRPAADVAQFPASFAQERLWFVQQLDPRNTAYHLPAAFRLRGPLDVRALERSFQELLRRHEILRTGFELVDGQLRQRIAAPPPFRLPVVRAAGAAELERGLAETVREPFALAEPPLLRARLLAGGPGDHLLVLVLHHIVADGWSLGLITHELSMLYAAFRTGRPSPLGKPPLQFADYAVWERQRMHGERLQSQLAFWRRQLAGNPPPLNLPTDRPRPARQSFRGAALDVELPAHLTAPLKALGARARASLFMVLLAGFKALLHGYTGQTDLLVGTPAVNRDREELEPLIGFLINVLVLRTEAPRGGTFRELLARVRETVLSATANLDVPFEKVVEEVRPRRGLNQQPLAQVLFSFQRGPMRLRLEGIETAFVPVDGGTAKFDLYSEWWETDAGIAGRLEYSTDLFDASRAERLVADYQKVLEAVAANPEIRLAELRWQFQPAPTSGASAAAWPTATARNDGEVTAPLPPETARAPAPVAAWPAVQGAIEQKLEQIWRQVLRLGTAPVGPNGDFFELGGHSLLITQVVARVREAFQVTLPMESLFEAPTIAQLGTVIQRRMVEEIQALSDEEASRLTGAR